MIQFTLPVETLYVCTGLLLLAAALLAVWNSRSTSPALTRRGAILLGLAWTAFGTFEYWILGPHSALGRPDEYNVSIPWIYHLARFHDGGLYMHHYAGGVDASAGVAFGVQYLSLNVLFFGALPLWLALSVMNIGALGLGFAGGYRVARTALHLTRGKAAVVGLIASGTHLVNLAWAASGTGWTIALMPWGLYFLSLRTARPHYWIGVVFFAFIYSGSTGIIHSLPAFFAGLLVSCLFIRPAMLSRFLGGCFLFGTLCILNWADVLYALIQIGPESARATAVRVVPSLWAHLQANSDVLFLPLGLAALIFFLVRRNRRGVLLVLAFWLTFISGHWLGAVPWHSTGIGLLAAYRWDLVSDGYQLVSLLVAGQVLALSDWTAIRRLGPLRLPPLSALYLATLPVLALMHHKALNVFNYRYYGGSALFTHAPGLSSSSWHAGEPFRVVTDYDLFAPNTTNAYQLDTFEGSVQAFSLRQNRYYGWAVRHPAEPSPHTHVHFLSMPATESRFASVANLDGLRIANVRYVLGARPLADPELTLALHEESPQPPGWLRRWAPRESARAVYVHELAGSWPRAFAPAAIRFSANASGDEAFHREILGLVATPAMIVARDDAALLAGNLPLSGGAHLEKFAIVRDGFDLTVHQDRHDTPTPGAVVINAPYSRFWHATAQGRPRTIVPVNGIHMAVIVEPGDRELTVRYERQTLAGLLLASFKTPTSP